MTEKTPSKIYISLRQNVLQAGGLIISEIVEFYPDYSKDSHEPLTKEMEKKLRELNFTFVDIILHWKDDLENKVLDKLKDFCAQFGYVISQVGSLDSPYVLILQKKV